MPRDHTSVQVAVLNFWKSPNGDQRGRFWQVNTLIKTRGSLQWKPYYTDRKIFWIKDFYQPSADAKMKRLESWFPDFVNQVVETCDNSSSFFRPDEAEKNSLYQYMAHILWRQPEQREMRLQMLCSEMIKDTGVQVICTLDGKPVKKKYENVLPLAEDADLLNQSKMEKYLSRKFSIMRKKWLFIEDNSLNFITGNHPYYEIGSVSEGGVRTTIDAYHSRTSSYYFIVHPRLCLHFSSSLRSLLKLRSGLFVYDSNSFWPIECVGLNRIEEINLRTGVFSDKWIVSIRKDFPGFEKLASEPIVFRQENSWATN